MRSFCCLLPIQRQSDFRMAAGTACLHVLHQEAVYRLKVSEQVRPAEQTAIVLRMAVGRIAIAHHSATECCAQERLHFIARTRWANLKQRGQTPTTVHGQAFCPV